MKYHYILSAFSGRAGCCKGEVNLGHYPWAYSWLGRQRSSLQISLPVKLMVFPSGSEAKESTCNARDPDSIPESGRSSGEGTGNPLQYSCLENPMDRGAWRAAVHVFAELDKTEQLVMPSSRGSSQPRAWTKVSHIKGRYFTIWATREAQAQTHTYTHKIHLW